MPAPTLIYAGQTYKNFRKDIAFHGTPLTNPDVPLVAIELEFLVVDKKTKRPVPVGPWLIREAQRRSGRKDAYKEELYLNTVEVATDPRPSAVEAGEDLRFLVDNLAVVADEWGLELYPGSMPPIGEWWNELLTPDPRYRGIFLNLPESVQGEAMLGMHVHVSIPRRPSVAETEALAVRAGWAVTLAGPAIIGATASSAFHLGHPTPFAANRPPMWDSAFPHKSGPFLFRDYDEHAERLWSLAQMDRTIVTRKDTYESWRFCPDFGSGEWRDPEVPATIEDCIAVASIAQCLVTGTFNPSLPRSRQQRNATFLSQSARRWSRKEACRSGRGLESKIAAIGTNFNVEQVTIREHLTEVLTDYGEIAQGLKNGAGWDYFRQMMDRGTTAELQTKLVKQLNYSNGDGYRFPAEQQMLAAILPVVMGLTTERFYKGLPEVSRRLREHAASPGIPADVLKEMETARSTSLTPYSLAVANRNGHEVQ